MLVDGPYELALLASTLASLLVATLAVRRRPEPGAVTLAGLLAGSTIWSGTILTELLVANERLAATVHFYSEIGVVLVVACYVLFALQYTGRGDLVDRRTVLALAIEPVVAVAFAVTTASHGLFYAEWTRAASDMIATTGGPVFWIHVVYSYLLVVAATGMLLRTAGRSPAVSQPGFAALAVAIFTPWVANLLYLFGPSPVDLTPFGFAVTGVSLYVALVRYDFMTLTPVARDTLVELLEDAMIVLDDRDRVIDVNPAFCDRFDLGDADVIGRPVDRVLGAHPSLLDALATTDDPEVVEVETRGATQFLKVTGTSLDGRAGSGGRLFLCHDLTPQRRQRRELERRNEQLDRFASLVSHDLRNPLDVAMGRAEVSRDLAEDPEVAAHLDQIADAHDRMRRIIDDVLALARQGRSIDDEAPVDLGTLAADAWSQVDTDRATLDVETDATVVADEGRLAQIFENLFRNAVEHGGDVTVRVGDTGDGFFVADDGDGIPPGERDRILDAGVSASDDGTGLGLAIVTAIAEAHGWTVGVDASRDGGLRIEFAGVSRAATGERPTAPSRPGRPTDGSRGH